jgi:hypothetical protein
MCKTCANRVQTLPKSSGHEYNLCAGPIAKASAPVKNYTFSTNCTRLLPSFFSTQKITRFSLVDSTLSTVYTGPITITTKYINK